MSYEEKRSSAVSYCYSPILAMKKLPPILSIIVQPIFLIVLKIFLIVLKIFLIVATIDISDSTEDISDSIYYQYF